jgi:Zn-finger nucleic acid-binding protein
MAMICLSCTSRIEEGRKGRPPVEAKFCPKCRAELRRRTKLKYIWQPQHEAYMRAHYHGGLHQSGRVIKELARQTGFPRWYVKRQAQRLGLTMHPDRRLWNQQELDTLDKLLGKVSAATIAKRLKRTETSVVMKIKALGHSRRVTESYTVRDLELCLGEDHHKIQKWIANGWLRDGFKGAHLHNGNGHDIHRFREIDILNFIKARPQEVNLGKVDQTWFLDLVLLRGVESCMRASPCPITDDND